MTNAELRAAAELLVEPVDVNDWEACETAIDGVVSHILATILPDGDEPITGEWLLREWVCERHRDEESVPVEQLRFKTKHGFLYMWDYYGDWVLSEMDRFPFSTRQQFAQLAAALGIQRKKGAE